MSRTSPTIPKQPVLKPAEDFYRLRREGIGFIEQMGSSLWTDYNTHDPGITILEALCYAITDLAYRTGWNIQDILAPAAASANPSRPFPNQPFFTARDILTVNPWTPDDFRRLLIDLDTVRNAWIFCKTCACDVHYYAWCEDGQLRLSCQKPADPALTPRKVEPLGLYEVLLELESDPALGDLNDRRIEHTYEMIDDDGSLHSVRMEVRFPEWGLGRRQEWKWFLEKGGPFHSRLSGLGATKTYNVLTDPALDEDERDRYLRNHWASVLYLDFEIELLPGGEKIIIENAALRIFGNALVKDRAKVVHLKAILEDETAARFIDRYRSKLLKVEEAVGEAKKTLRRHRNLDEDFCRVRGVSVEDVGVCADVEVAADADIERIQARIWFEIEQVFNPPVLFYTVQELMDAGVPVEDIFNGPGLSNGFIKSNELEKAGLRTVLRTSDILNHLMDIEGIVAVNNLMLTKYDSEGKILPGAADPDWNDGTPLFDADKVSASWLLFVSPLHQPRLYHNQSSFLFTKNGLPFKPRMDEAYDTLTQLRGEAERPKIKDASNDLPIPAGAYRNPEAYYPVQYGFPLTYGIGPDGLPSNASTLRRAQAKQLKAYLLVFEQILGNAFAQIAHTADLFSLDENVKHTYFAGKLGEAIIHGYHEIVAGLDETELQGMVELQTEFSERRNRFLSHIMARFGEQFTDYALMLTNLEGRQIALDQLIHDKISFLKDYPRISHNRGKAFDYKEIPCSGANIPELLERVRLLLGELGHALNQAIVVEHLLLRPKFPGDALYPACSEGSCELCGDEDPYSFRLTFVMPVRLEPFSTDMRMRDFAERTIRQETPSHLLAKICWVGNDSGRFDRFEAAWCRWLEADAAIDWTEERLAERVESILTSSMGNSSDPGQPPKGELCRCAAAILTSYGMAYHDWMETNLRDGKKSLNDFTPFTPAPIDLATLCTGLSFKTATAGAIEALLKERYHEYEEVSFRLRVLLNRLGELSNIYPVATLHDCDEGSDQNPVRLGKTALGSL
jgi:hypothetical protein